MKRDLSIEAMVGLPILSSGTGVVLCTQLIATASAQKDTLAASGLSYPQCIADSLQDLQASFQQLSAVRVPSVSDPTAKKEADTALDVAWKNLHDSLVSWNNTAAPANADPEGTKRLMSFLFADGLKFTRAKYLEEWEASQSRIAGLARDPAYTQTIARHNLQVLLQVVQDAHAAYGAALGITQPAEVSDSTAVRDALKEVTFRLRVYVLQVVAYGYSHVIDAPTLAEVLLEPLAVWVSPVPEKATASEPATAGAVSTTSPPAGTA